MEGVLDSLRHAGAAAGTMLLQPYLYAAVLFIVLLAVRQARAERRMFHAKLTAWPVRVLPSLLAGLVAGAAISVVMLFLGVGLNADAIYWLWGASLLLGLLRIRYMAFVYGAGLVALLQWGAGWFDWSGTDEIVRRLTASLDSFDAAGLLLLAGLLQLAEALLMKRQGARTGSPVYVEGKRGRPLGGFRLDAYWPVPMLLLVPSADGADAAMQLPWTPFLWLDGAPAGWTFLGLPAIIGLGLLTTSLQPKDKAVRSAQLLFWTGLAAAGAGAAAVFRDVLIPAAAIAAPVLHEMACYIERSREDASSPLFMHDAHGLRVLAVLPGTPAAQLGIVPGELLHKVNGTRIRTAEDLYDGLLANSAFCKLELLNNEGHIRFVQRARFENEHHQLGFVLGPGDMTTHVADGVSQSLLGLMPWARAARRRTGTAGALDNSMVYIAASLELPPAAESTSNPDAAPTAPDAEASPAPAAASDESATVSNAPDVSSAEPDATAAASNAPDASTTESDTPSEPATAPSAPDAEMAPDAPAATPNVSDASNISDAPDQSDNANSPRAVDSKSDSSNN